MIYNSLSKETLIKIIQDKNIKIESQIIEIEEKNNIISKYKEKQIQQIQPVSPMSINNWRLQVYGGHPNGKSIDTNKRNIMNIFCEKKIHLIDLIKKNKNNVNVGINNHRNNQMKRMKIGDKVYMCDNVNFYYEGILKENYKHYNSDKLIEEYKDIIYIIWGQNIGDWQQSHNTIDRFYISRIDWVKKPLSEKMKLYLIKSTKNGGGRIDIQGTVLKLCNLTFI